MTVFSHITRSLKARRLPITLEPMLFVYFFTVVMSNIVSNNMLFRKGCDPDATVEPNLVNATCPLVLDAQQEVASIQAWKQVIQELVALTFIMFAGPWSDNNGRRRLPLMFVPVVGQVLCDTCNLLFSVFWREVSPMATGIVQAVTVASTGSIHCFFIGMYAYVSDITDETNRTMRLGFASSIVPLAATLGPLVSGYLNVLLGFKGVYALCIVLNFVALSLGYLLIYDTSEKIKKTGSAIKNTFDLQVVAKSFGTVFVKRENHKRTVLLLMIVTSPLTITPFMGEMALMYLFLTKKFNFNEISFSLFHSYTMGIMLFGTLLSLGLFSRILKMNDASIGFIATIFDIATAVGFLVVNETWQLMYVPLLEIFRGAVLSITGSIASKCVEAHELASMNSVRLIVESLFKSFLLPLYNIVYKNTLNTFPSAFFIISIVLSVPLLFLFSITYFLTRDQPLDAKTEECTSNKTTESTAEQIGAEKF
ncbi:proton-coupled folate transporter-like [Adelges cooleyi]|uniref:proton-coupled folate transporter-like n=1 Tax=Adelges cooleyi TaxID=133065 RepID=UPI00217F48A7|nr:proton-coupled folate transporter-like [Adelges cooleyi]